MGVAYDGISEEDAGLMQFLDWETALNYPRSGVGDASSVKIDKANFISPNPASNFININAEFRSAELVDLFGNSFNISSKQVDLSEFNSGIYLVKIETN